MLKLNTLVTPLIFYSNFSYILDLQPYLQIFEDRFSLDARHLTLSFGIRETFLCNMYTAKPHFYIAKLGYAGVYLFSYFAPKHRLWVHVRTINEYLQSMFLAKIRKY